MAVAVVSWAGIAPAADARSEEEVTFRSGPITLTGTLLRPSQVPPLGAVVLVHGSGPGPRQGLRLLAEHLSSAGLAALIYDKRGSGGSGGSWLDASLEDLAGDVLSAAAFLHARPDLAGSLVGALGVSQGGWVVPRAVALRPGVLQFAIVVTGGGLRPADVERHDYAEALDRSGATDEQRREGVALVERYLTYLATGADRDGLQTAISHAQTTPALRALNLDRVLPTPAMQPQWAWVATYDPGPDIQKLQIPLLVVVGGRDRPTLAATMTAQWRANLVQARNSDATVLELLGAGHGATVPGTHHAGPAPQAFVPGYLEMLDGWLKGHRLIP
jgi:uncharacterized protein